MSLFNQDGLSVRPSIDQPVFKVLEQVMLQVEYHCFADLRSNRVDPLYKELCLIIAEVLLLNPDAVLKINGNLIATPVAQDVFSQIRNRHLRLVFDNFHNVPHRVFNKKAYLRTALYNAFFEYESHYINLMAQD